MTLKRNVPIDCALAHRSFSRQKEATLTAPAPAKRTLPTSPAACVVMTVYNDLRFLDAAVASVLAQDFRDFEFIIVDDATGQPDVFDALAHLDPRIRVLVNPSNLGAAVSANRAIAATRADIIVRLDADDIAEPSRVGRLVAALRADPTLGLVGSAVTLIDETDRPCGLQPMPRTDAAIRWTILFHNPFYHSAVAFRRTLFERVGGYRPEERVSQDHYLWFDLLPHCRARNLSEPLTRYRLNSQGLTALHAADNPRRRTHPIREELWKRLGLVYPLHDNARADDVSAFLRGQGIADTGRRMSAYRLIISTFMAFAAKTIRSDGDRHDIRRLARSLVVAMLSAPPKGGDVWRLRVLCLRLDWRATLLAGQRGTHTLP